MDGVCYSEGSCGDRPMTRNTRSDYGMAVAADRHSMQDGNWLNDTRKPKWSVDVEADPSHLRVLDDFPGGTKFTLTKGASAVAEETLFAIKHKMPWSPQVLCFFYTKDAPAGSANQIGTYTLNTGYMFYDVSGGIGREVLFADVDEEYFYIKHRAETMAYGSGTHTFSGSDYKFRVRFMILNHPRLGSG